jgi:hypothetical protein
MPKVIFSPPVVEVFHALTVPYGEQVCTLSDTHGQTINIYQLWDFLPIFSRIVCQDSYFIRPSIKNCVCSAPTHP